MFKRVEKKRKKLEEEEELGIDEDMKEFMGFNDTDSDESASDSDSSSDGHSDAEQLGEEDLEEAEDENIDEMEGANASDDEEPPISLSEALRDPIYVVSLDPLDVRACILCKGKVIKGAQMSTVHKASTAHKRRFERFKTLSANVDPQSDAWQVARTIQKEASNPTGTRNRPDTEGGMSKRALKRSAKQASIKEKRMLHNKLRTKAKAKSAASKASQSQDAAGKESAALEPLEIHDVEKLDASPQKPLEPQKKKRKVQRDQIVTSSASPGAPVRLLEKPLSKPKAPREKERTRAKAT
ncbi:uncharacterized protein EDB91DRAFT_1124188 [Suillus paluster]|uniref:uncharacterized protein n=1 Tax=Suillus paluster TaxID=48578 RepID=UPI001B87A539|nr:uncharacterized protein EDB91DRAFT_1124188 [Suillus paluster]KAG1744012.1 hypothetical protein EDB91DRAFT_1124188 [Suillus paluster]